MRASERSWWWVKERKQMVLVFIIVTVLLQFQMKGCVGCSDTERISLLQLKSYLKNVLNVKEERFLKSWSHDDAYNSDCCKWERVNCSDAVGGHIVALSLDGLNPVYEEPPPRSLNLSLLHSFPQLKSLDFSYNGFSHLFDPIHGYKSFQRLEKLRILDLSDNYFNNSVLPFVSAARSLRTLVLSGNSLEGVFPPNELANLTKLEVLNMEWNGFSLFSVQGLINLTELEVLDLSYNSINDLEAGDGLRTTKLKSLYLSTNKFSEKAKLKGFEYLVDLKVLGLQRNELNHTESIRGLKYMPKLQELDLSYNKFTDLDSLELANMTELRVLNLASNRFSSFSVQGLINLTELEELDLSENSINDVEAGDGLRTTKLKSLDLSINKFSDNARFEGLGYLVELKVLGLQWNELKHTESIRVLKDMPKLQELDLSRNEFTDLDSLGLTFPSSLQVLNLKENQLSSTRKGYSDICRLMNLKELDLSKNALTSMPNCLGNLTRLRTLVLRDNQLNGNLSSFVSSLPSALEYLSLLDNNFNGSFLLKSLVNYTRLEVFILSSEAGMIQAQAENSWVPLFQLKMLVLQNVGLGGTILGFLLNQHDLRYIDLSHNKLTGAFPSWLVKNNTRLEAIYMDSNSLTEFRLPRLVHGLIFLNISSNMIYDSIPEDIGIVFPRMEYIYFASNHFHGTIPSSMGEMRSLQQLDMSSNGLYGQLPKTVLSSCYSLSILKLSNNQLEGNIFPEHANFPMLAWLLVDGNRFRSLGKGLLNSISLVILDLSHNSISGRLPLWIGRFSRLNYLYTRGNQLKGPFPSQLQNLQQLRFLDISHNSLFGSIPRNFDFPFLSELRLQSNEFMGSIPDALFKGEQLELLDLRNNNFSGKILNTIGEMSNLRVLLLRNNSLQGHIPEKIGQVLSKVGLLDLSHNLFQGAIPSSLANMSFGPERSDGSIPPDPFSKIVFREFLSVDDRNWKYTSTLWSESGLTTTTILPAIVEFDTKSRYEAYQGDAIGYMYGLDLSSNQLSGEIPVEIGELKNIKSLNFSSNRLTGSIPASFSKLEDLESLDLSNNKLNGIIPPQLANLNSLGYLDVSFNNLSGKIPLNGHLLTFDEKSYIGNAHLCGPPTNTSCDPTSVPQPSAEEEEEEEGDGVIDMVWFYWTCGAVYIPTFLAMFAFLCIDSRWSEECFYRVDLFIHHLQIFKRRFMCN